MFARHSMPCVAIPRLLWQSLAVPKARFKSIAGGNYWLLISWHISTKQQVQFAKAVFLFSVSVDQRHHFGANLFGYRGSISNCQFMAFLWCCWTQQRSIHSAGHAELHLQQDPSSAFSVGSRNDWLPAFPLTEFVS